MIKETITVPFVLKDTLSADLKRIQKRLKKFIKAMQKIGKRINNG